MGNLYKPAYRTGRKYEMLSAYIDNELSDAEVKKLEEELKFSKELREKLAELKKIKELTTSSVKNIEENPFFETRLAAAMRIKKPWYSKLGKLSPVYGIIAVSLILMVVLKYNPQVINNLLDKQKSNITAFYKQNLKPLLYAADLTNEDIFNFAFYHQLPLDNRKQQFLQFGSDSNGNQFFEIKNAGAASSRDNLKKFIHDFNLNKDQERHVDSILSSYADDLQSQVLVNEKSTVAINPNIWNYNKALAADLISYLTRINKNELQRALPRQYEEYYNRRNVAQMVSEIKSSKNNNYIFFTPDSIFSEPYKFDKDQYKQEMKQWADELKDNMKDLNNQFKNFSVRIHFGDKYNKLKSDSSWAKDFKVFVDSNYCKVHIPSVIIPPIQLPNMENFSIRIDSLNNLFKEFSFNFPNPGKNKSFNYKYFYNDSSKGLKFNFKAFGFDSSFAFKNHKLDSLLAKKFKGRGFKLNPDSLAAFYKAFTGDTTEILQQKQLQEQMKQFQQEMENFRKEMEKWQKQFQKDLPKQAKKNPIEI